ncbi:aldehyde dehydrogenase family protein [Acinetobacter guillouiae]|jgi:phenylacetaldehyde dehydrogenase|uniref:aldehyde dehydrogenase family protein n=1 Tax=Acinetobacter guillouiae TaxID=106649 RepID=UPI0028D4271B|nr:aldehyde dehydrogenase family protein [Acinetobacter guillouiae]
MSQIEILDEVQQFLQRQHGHFIAGKSYIDANEVRIDIINPATELAVASIADASVATVALAAQSAETSFKNVWSKVTPYERSLKLNKLAELVEQNAEELAQLETLSSGKIITIARHLEVAQTAVFLRHFASCATKIEGKTIQPSLPSMQGEQYTAFTIRQPIGVVAGIVPWNFTLMIGAWKIGSALSTGCTIVVKPSEFTSLSLLRLAELAIQAGIPEGVINVVTGAGKTGQYLIDSPLVKKVSFTGSVPTGIRIGQQTMHNDLKRVSLELGGKNAAALLSDVNIDEILPVLIQSTFVHQGQVCAAPERIFVHQSKYDEFVTKASAVLQSMPMGSPLDAANVFGPLSNKAHYEKVQHYLSLARAKGQILSGGEDVEGIGYFVKPALIKVDDVHDPLFIEETFGPVISVIPFDTEEALLSMINNSRFGLAASVWSNDMSKIFRLIPKIEAGSVWVNMHTFLDPSVPFGGMKASGIGREFSDAYIDDYTELKSVMMRF